MWVKAPLKSLPSTVVRILAIEQPAFCPSVVFPFVLLWLSSSGGNLFVYTFGLSSPRHRTRPITVRCRTGFSDGRVYGLRAEYVQGKR